MWILNPVPMENEMSDIEQVLEILRDFRQRSEANYENRSLVDRKSDYLRGYADGAREAANLVFLFAYENGARNRLEELEIENERLREAIKKARVFVREVANVTSRDFAFAIGITATQLSQWTASTPNKKPDFKD